MLTALVQKLLEILIWFPEFCLLSMVWLGIEVTTRIRVFEVLPLVYHTSVRVEVESFLREMLRWPALLVDKINADSFIF
jgi:hypothetical protein